MPIFAQPFESQSQDDANTVGTCPKCNLPIIEFKSGYACKSSNKEHTCFKVWKSILNKSISAAQLKQLINKG